MSKLEKKLLSPVEIQAIENVEKILEKVIPRFFNRFRKLGNKDTASLIILALQSYVEAKIDERMKDEKNSTPYLVC